MKQGAYGKGGDYSSVGERMRRRREKLELSIEEVAMQLDMSKVAYVIYEDGFADPSLGRLERFGVVLQCQPAWLAYGFAVLAPDSSTLPSGALSNA